jgi:hypothetical protein
LYLENSVFAQRKAVRSNADSLHVESLIRIRERRKPIMIAAPGKYNSESNLGGPGFAYYWPFVYGDNTSGSTFFDVPIMLDASSGRIIVKCVFGGVYIQTATAALSRADIEDSRDLPVWDLTLEATQLANGDLDFSAASSIGSQSISPQISHYPTQANRFERFLTQQRRLHEDDATTRIGRVYREGQLFPEDYVWLSTIEANFSFSGASIINPARLTLDVVLNSKGVKDEEDLRLSLVGVSAWQELEV